MEQTPTRIQLHAMRRELGRMLDECRGICKFATQANVRECKICDHGERLRALGRKIEETQRIDRKERGVKRRLDRDESDGEKTVEWPTNVFTFSKRYSTFNEWLSSQKQPYSEYVSGIARLHEKYPNKTLDELAIIHNQIQRRRTTK